jgi:hypothetical protein
MARAEPNPASSSWPENPTASMDGNACQVIEIKEGIASMHGEIGLQSCGRKKPR